jgi:hypothetical protein
MPSLVGADNVAISSKKFMKVKTEGMPLHKRLKLLLRPGDNARQVPLGDEITTVIQY